jgi:hypothetical protein
MFGADDKQTAGNREASMAHRPENPPVKIKKEYASQVVVIDDDDSDYGETRPKRKRQMPHVHRENHKLHEANVKNRSVADPNDSLRIHENLRDQIYQWSERTQQLESAQASLKRDVQDLEKGISQLQLQNHSGKYESLVRRIDGLEDTLKNIQNAGDQQATTAAAAHAPEAGLLPTQGTTEERKPSIFSIKAPQSSPSVQVPGSLNLETQDYAMSPILTNEGLGRLLRNINFSDLSHLRTLCELDSRKVSRDAPLFCDRESFSLFQIDYVVRGGPTAAYIGDHPNCSVSSNHDQSLGKLKLHGLQGLRVLKLTYHAKVEDRTIKEQQEAKRSMTTWKNMFHPPRYIYDLGQLFLHRKGGKEGNRFHLVATKYNVVMDMTCRHKPVWLVMRPEFEPTIHRSIGRGVHRDSENPFQSRHGYDLERSVTAQLAKKIDDLNTSGESFAQDSYPAFIRASEVVVETSCDEALRLQFSIPDLDEMLQVIGKGWSIGFGHDHGNSAGFGRDDDDDSI